MPHRFIADLKARDTLTQFFLLRQVVSRLTKEGMPYLDLVLADRSGAVKAKVWKEALQKCSGPLKPCDFVAVDGVLEDFQGLQINVKFIDTIERLRAKGRPLEDFDPEILISSTPFNRDDLWAELLELVQTDINPPLKELVLGILLKYGTQFMDWPGAVFYHHAYAGGLLEHTLTVARHAQRCLEIYPTLNHSLVLAGAILHDLGKLKEYTGPPCPQRTVAGELLGHIVLGWEMVREEARIRQFSDEKLLLSLEHIIIAHHGSVEFGSPKIPLTPEGLLVYHLDEIDARLHMALRHLDTDPSEGDFTSYHKGLKRSLYRPGTPSESPPESSPSDDS